MKLTKSQIEALENLLYWYKQDHSYPWARAGNHFRGFLASSANALIKRGMARKRGGLGFSSIEFRITQDGLDALKKSKDEQEARDDK